MWWRRHADYARADIRSRQDTVIYFIIYFLSMGDGANRRGPTAASGGSARPDDRLPQAESGGERVHTDRSPVPRTPRPERSRPSIWWSFDDRGLSRENRLSLKAHELSRRSCNGTRFGPAARCAQDRAEGSRGGRRTNSPSKQSRQRTVRRR
jgi:hypothetical protein